MTNEPNQLWSDLEEGELQVLKRLGVSARSSSSCPPPGLVRAFPEGALPDEIRPRVERHIQNCRTCQILARDLPAVEASLSREGRERIHSRVFPHTGGRRQRTWAWRFAFQLLPAGVIAAAIIAGVWIYTARRSRSHELASAQQTAVERKSSVFVLDKPVVMIPVTLLTRGSSSDQSYPKDLVNALQPYRAGQYTETVSRLQTLSKKYPSDPEIPFYLGAAQLFLGNNLAAEQSLLRAESLAQGPFLQECQWYLALASVRVKNFSEASRTLQDACATTGEYQARACSGLRELRPQASSPSAPQR